MFDISFWELFISGVIALIILGPERLPKAAKTIGVWVGKAKRSFNAIKQDIDHELQMEELKKQLQEQKQQIEQDSSIDSIKDDFSEAKQTIENFSNDHAHKSPSMNDTSLKDNASKDKPTPSSLTENKQQDKTSHHD